MSWIAVVAVLGMHAAPEYTRYRLHELVALADKAVVGTISALQEETFDLEVERTLFGGSSSRLRLRRFRNWTCARRWAAYEEGQRVLLFVKGGRAMGGGDEGDMPLVGDGVLVPYFVRGSRYVRRAIHGGSLDSSWVPLEDMAAAMVAYRASFSFRSDRFRLTRSLRVVDEDALDPLRTSSAFAGEVVDETLRCRCFLFASKAPTEYVPEGVLNAAGIPLEWSYTPDDGVEVLSRFGRALLFREQKGRNELLVGTGGAVMRLHGVLDLDASEAEKVSLRRLGREEMGSHERNFGRSLIGLGDLDGDGWGEFASSSARDFSHHVGRRDEPHSAGLQFISWPPDEDPVLIGEVNQQNSPEGLVDGCSFGRALCNIGDLDRDGYPELAVARTPDLIRKDGESRQGPDSLAIVFLGAGGAVRSWRPIGAESVGYDAPDRFASVLMAPGDVDGDGIPDLLLGEPLDCERGTYHGALRLLFLQPNGEVRSWTRIDDSAFGLEGGDELGLALAPLGDLDADGTIDFVVAGTRSLWTVSVRHDGSSSSVQRFALESLQPGAVEPIALAPANGTQDGVRLLLSARRGTSKPLDVGLSWFRCLPDGTLRPE